MTDKRGFFGEHIDHDFPERATPASVRQVEAQTKQVRSELEMNKQKTPGQIAYEKSMHTIPAWEWMAERNRDRWESIANASRADLIAADQRLKSILTSFGGKLRVVVNPFPCEYFITDDTNKSYASGETIVDLLASWDEHGGYKEIDNG